MIRTVVKVEENGSDWNGGGDRGGKVGAAGKGLPLTP